MAATASSRPTRTAAVRPGRELNGWSSKTSDRHRDPQLSFTSYPRAPSRARQSGLEPSRAVGPRCRETTPLRPREVVSRTSGSPRTEAMLEAIAPAQRHQHDCALVRAGNNGQVRCRTDRSARSVHASSSKGYARHSRRPSRGPPYPSTESRTSGVATARNVLLTCGRIPRSGPIPVLAIDELSESNLGDSCDELQASGRPCRSHPRRDARRRISACSA